MMTSLRRRGLFAGAAMLGLGSVTARAFPDRSVRLVVPFSPGGTVDLVGRLVAAQFSTNTGQTMVVDNRGGAAGEIGSALVVRAPADGYTLLVGSTTTITIQPLVNPALSYDPMRQLQPICLVAYVPQVLLVNPALPVHDLAGFVARMKARPVSFGDGGAGTPHYAAVERLRCATGTSVIHVPYRGGGAAHADLIAGHIEAAFIELSVASPYMRGGQLRPVAIAARERHAGFLDLPTLAEQGIPDCEITSWFGIFAPTGTPAPVMARLSAEVLRVLGNAEVREKLNGAGATVVASTPDELSAHMQREQAKWDGLLKLNCGV